MFKTLYRRFNWLQNISEPSTGDKVSFELKLGALHVGTLTREAQEWVFAYSDAFARQRRVAPLVDFPMVGRVYRSEDLWPFFALRIPSTTQASVQAFLREQGETKARAVEMIQKFGRRSISNPFVLTPA
jgi:hypothetical protein